MESIRIASLELENVKKVRALSLTPAESGLTTIGGGNRQGKTSVLDAICFALGGERYRPTNLKREGGIADPTIIVTLSNGVVVERKGKNSALRVTDPTGQKGGQKLLDSFVDELALNMPKFLSMTGKEKAAVLLRILGIGDQLAAIEADELKAFEERKTAGRIADQKEKFAAEMQEYHDVPDVPLTAGELVAESQAVMQRNAEKAAARASVAKLAEQAEAARQEADRRRTRRDELARMLADAEKEAAMATDASVRAAQFAAAANVPQAPDESLSEIEAKLAEMENINAKVRANMDKAKALADAEEHRIRVSKLTEAVEAARARKAALLDGAAMPLPGLSVENGELTYAGKAWDCMSGAERIRAGVAIVRRLKPECGFVLLDGLEAFDCGELQKLCAWLEAEGLQAIGTRVSTGGECTIIIEDGVLATDGEQCDNAEENNVDEAW